MKKIPLAGCVILDDAGKVLLIHRNTERLVQWELPGGKLEAGETLEQAAAREVLEEIDVHVAITNELGGTTFDDNGKTWEYHWFAAKIIYGIPKVGEPATFDGVGYFDLLDPDLAEKGISINIVALVKAIKKGEVKL